MRKKNDFEEKLEFFLKDQLESWIRIVGHEACRIFAEISLSF
jgi:hypothetical protein